MLYTDLCSVVVKSFNPSAAEEEEEEADLRVCVEDFDPLGGDEQIHLREGLCISICTLLQDKTHSR